MNKSEICKKIYSGELKLSFMNLVDVKVCVYSSYVRVEGAVVINDNKIEEWGPVIDIEYEKIRKIDFCRFKDKFGIRIDFFNNTLMGYIKNYIILFGLYEIEDCKNCLVFYKNKRDEYLKIKRENEIKAELAEKKEEEDALTFFNDCYNFHIKEDTPKFELFKEKNKLVTVYIDEDKNLNFLKIDGYEKDEDIGIITYDRIHYYEKAGNVHYISETNGSYSSFGGSLTGATFSKRATLLHGLLFGPMGMATAALMSYKPAEQKPSETHFDIASETKRIDERNVLLNFYSDEKKQYVDIELPQDIYNFLQTYIPDKRYSIVNEIEKHSAVRKSVDNLKLDAPEPRKKLPQTSLAEDDSMDSFKTKVEKLKIMREAGLLTDEEFNSAKMELLNNI